MNFRTRRSSVWVVRAGSQVGNQLVAKTSIVVRKTAKSAAKPRPKRPPVRLGAIKTGRIVNRLRELYELGGDPAFERSRPRRSCSSGAVTLLSAGRTASEFFVEGIRCDVDVAGADAEHSRTQV